MARVYCQLCGKLIADRSRYVRHPRWPADRSLRICTDCYHTRPRCKACGIPMAASLPGGLCPTCAESIPICQGCGRPVQGSFLVFDGRVFCPDCSQSRPACDGCGAPQTDERWQLSDGRILCVACHMNAVYSPDEARALYEQMKSVALHSLGLKLNVPTGLALVDRNQLAEIIRQQSNGDLSLDPEKTLGIYARRGMKRGIYVQTGLPRALLTQIAAHEFAHAWQGENCPLLREPLMHEGFAEWTAYQILDQYGYAGLQKQMLARTDVYGQGLRWALDLEQRVGMEGLIAACRTAQQAA